MKGLFVFRNTLDGLHFFIPSVPSFPHFFKADRWSDRDSIFLATRGEKREREKRKGGD